MESIDLIVATGMSSLGAFVGIVVGLYAGYLNATQAKNLKALISSVGASAVFAVIAMLQGTGSIQFVREGYFYPMGLLGGLLLGLLIAVAYQIWEG